MTDPAFHYELHGYVCKDKTVKPSPFEGWVTWDQICLHAPANTRYAVVRKLPLRNHCGKVILAHRADGPFLVLDLATNGSVRADWRRRMGPPEPTWTAPNAAAATMKAVMCHGE